MAWQNPKTDWAVNPKNPVPEDFNRIEGNIDFLKTDIEAKKGVIVDAITDMNQPAEVTDTHAELAGKIRDISNDATAVTGDVESGKTFYSGGQKRTGTLELTGNAGTGDVLSGKTFYNTALKTKRTGAMPNRGAVVITPGTSNQAIVAGYHNGQGYVKGDANLKAENIGKGKKIFDIDGAFEAYFAAGDNVLIALGTGASVTSTSPTKVKEVKVLFSGSVRITFRLAAGGYLGPTVYGRIYVNSSPKGQLRSTTSNSGVTFTEDFVVQPNDLIQLYLYTSHTETRAGFGDFALLISGSSTKTEVIL